MDSEKIFYFKNTLLIILSFIAISSYMIISPSGIDLLFDDSESTTASSYSIISNENTKFQNKVFI